MNDWFRLYADVINDPKVMRLSEATRWQWVAFLCVASRHDGVLPGASDMAFLLRLSKSRVASLIAELHSAGLLDKLDGGRFAPHNWNRRQYKTDAADPTAAERMRRYRANRNGDTRVTEAGEPDQERNQDRNNERNSERNDRNAAVTLKRPDSDSDSDTDSETEQIDADADAAGVRGQLIDCRASELAERLLVIAGHDPNFWPPSWCGAPLRVKTWLKQGWPAEIILAASEAAAKRKTGPPAASVQFFEKAIAEEIARQAAPLPIVTIKPGENIDVRAHARPTGNILQAADRLVATIRSFDARPSDADHLRGGTGAAAARLLPSR